MNWCQIDKSEKMNCKFVKYNIINYLNSQLKGLEIQAFESHLERCESCRTVFEEIAKTYNLLEEDKNVQSNPFFYTRLEQRIKNEQQSLPGFVPQIINKTIRPLMAALLILLSILSGVLIGSHFTDGVYAGSSYDSELEYYTESVYFNNVDDEPIEYYLLNQNEE